MRKGKLVLILAHKRWWLLLFSVTLALVSAQSQEPPPSGWESSKVPQTHPKSGHQDAAKDKRSTKKPPIVIQEPPSVDDKKQTAKARDERKKEAPDDWWLTFWAGGLVIVTLLLVAVGAWQVILFRQQLKLMRTSVDDGATVATAALDTSRITREEFIASHRPRIIVRRFFHVIIKGGHHAVQYTIANTGDTDATIVKLSAWLWDKRAEGALTSRRYPSIPDYATSKPRDDRIKSGEAITEKYYENADTFLADGESDRITSELEPAPLFLGYIVYKDGSGTKRMTGFCRTYERSTKSFIPIDDKDWEYQD